MMRSRSATISPVPKVTPLSSQIRNNLMKTCCTIVIHDAALSPLPADAGLIYAAVTPRRRAYRHGTESSIVELNSTNRLRPADRLFAGKQDVLARLGNRGVEAFDYGEFLTIPGPQLVAAGVSITGVENVVQRLFVLASGALPLGNSSTRRDLYIKLPVSTTVIHTFGQAIEAAFANLCNDVFMDRLRTAMDSFGRWGDGPCSRNLPAVAPVMGRRHFVPVAPQGGAGAAPQPTGLTLTMAPTPAIDAFVGVEPVLYRDASSGPPCPLPGQGVNADYNTADETHEIGILATLA